MKRLNLEHGKEELISTRGNHACGHFLREAARRHLPTDFQQRREGAISDRDILLTMTGMLSNSRTDFVDVDLYREDTVFAHSFGIDELPSEPTLRQRLDELPAQRSHDCLRATNLSILQGRSFQTVRAGELDLVPVDIDVSPLDNSGSNKQGVSFTYKKHDGYAPIFAYIGAEGYMLDHELRPGKQHCQEGAPQFIGSCVRQLEALKLRGRCLIRLDSGNDAEDNFAHLGDQFWIIKRNLRKEKREQWLAIARRVGDLKTDTRDGKNVYTGFVDHLKPGGAKSQMQAVSVAFEVTERLTDPEGNLLLIP